MQATPSKRPTHPAGFPEAIPNTPEEALRLVPETAQVSQSFVDIVADTPSLNNAATQTVSLHNDFKKDCEVRLAAQTWFHSA